MNFLAYIVIVIKVEIADDVEDDLQDEIEDEVDGGGVMDDDFYGGGGSNEDRLESSEVSLDSSHRQIHTSAVSLTWWIDKLMHCSILIIFNFIWKVDPIHWKTELERVGPKLRAKQALPSNEWRAHVDMTLTNKTRIEQVLDDTQADLKGLNRFNI